MPLGLGSSGSRMCSPRACSLAPGEATSLVASAHVTDPAALEVVRDLQQVQDGATRAVGARMQKEQA